jgi:hypothetical protein
MSDASLPPEFLGRLRQLEEAYLKSDDSLKQSGFGGGPERWRREREPILGAIESGAARVDLIDTGCANGYLLECLMDWATPRSLEITPFGIDYSGRLIERAQRRLPRFADHFQSANAWDWQPPRRWQYVYALWDCVPKDYLTEFIRRLIARYVAPGGRLILGSYGSLSRNEQPFDLETFLGAQGHRVVGAAWGGTPPVARFAWLDP